MVNGDALRVLRSQLEVELAELLFASLGLLLEQEGWKLLLFKCVCRLRVHDEVERVFGELLDLPVNQHI